MIHSGEAKFCHYFSNGKCCPFDAIGCMFRHEMSQKCNLESCRDKLCQNQHSEVEEMDEIVEELCDMAQDEDIENDDAKYGENDCHLCEQTFTCLDDLCEHFQISHEEYYDKIQNLVVF